MTEPTIKELQYRIAELEEDIIELRGQLLRMNKIFQSHIETHLIK